MQSDGVEEWSKKKTKLKGTVKSPEFHQSTSKSVYLCRFDPEKDLTNEPHSFVSFHLHCGCKRLVQLKRATVLCLARGIPNKKEAGRIIFPPHGYDGELYSGARKSCEHPLPSLIIAARAASGPDIRARARARSLVCLSHCLLVASFSPLLALFSPLGTFQFSAGAGMYNWFQPDRSG